MNGKGRVECPWGAVRESPSVHGKSKAFRKAVCRLKYFGGYLKCLFYEERLDSNLLLQAKKERIHIRNFRNTSRLLTPLDGINNVS